VRRTPAVLLEEDADGISIVSHVGRPDEQLHELGRHEVLRPARLEQNEEYARRIVHGTAGFRLRVTRFDARLELSQHRSPEVVETIIGELEHGENYAQPGLAREMRRVHGE
jgi:predicted FMN-binding regulatory protein PaiB